MKLRQVCVALAAIVLSFAATSARAADKGPFSWTGFYIGGLATGVSGSSTHCDNQSCSLAVIDYPNPSLDGWMGGVTAGYNLQSGRTVIGLEVDWSWGKLGEGVPSTGSFGCVVVCETSIESIGTIRARFGYTFDRFLPYL